MTGPRSPRLLGLSCLGLVVAAGALWGAAALVWYRVLVPGRTPVELDGAAVSPSLDGLALVALAGVAALVATGGVVRRVLAGLLGLGGLAVGAVGLAALLGSPESSPAVTAVLPAVPPGATAPVPVVETTAAPLLVLAGGLLLVVVGVFVVLREPRLSRLGARYAAPGRRPVEVDPDRAAWQALDAGHDPTVGADPPADPMVDVRHDPGEGDRRGPL